MIEQRRLYAAQRFESLQQSLTEANAICSGKACVYATGSFARGEAHQWSDLDLFIVGQGSDEKRDLSRLDEIQVEADLIQATRDAGIPEFSGDGQYLVHFSLSGLIGTLGKPEDDVLNTFTARLLLLLESKPLLGGEVYHRVLHDVLGAYWLDYVEHKNDFVPAFLANDILRLWRTFCVNYEARTTNNPPIKKAKRKLKNYKLKYSRLLTCYSALLYLLTTHIQKGTVSIDDAKQMVALTPTQRLEWLLDQPTSAVAAKGIGRLKDSYLNFLTNTEFPEDDLVEKFLDRDFARDRYKEAIAFGSEMFGVLETIGRGHDFYRMLVV
jgi:hypothetical protein